ncbi:amino acid adenylation domain-containing protein [Sphaerisporangium sp. NPDC005289]|uniref:amino acid adenylation domain-containing protein n=1 Tax=Sphaerisporangium sp. NPDC005289 TaxID=3155247 RepID=UPI0033BF5641
MSADAQARAVANRQRLLDLLITREGRSNRITPADRAVDLPLSFAQQRLWTLDGLLPERSLYNAPLAYRIRGALDLSALRRAFTGVVARHEALRTTFAVRAGNPVQVIGAPRPIDIPVVSLAGRPDREAEAVRRSMAEARVPFDLQTDRPLRLELIELATDDHVLLITLHHIVTDTWSLGVMFGEIATLYAAARDGVSPALPDLAVQYADFALWQRRTMSGARMRGELAHWSDRLDGTPQILTLPSDRQRRAVPSFGGAEHVFTVPEPTVALLRSIATAQDATLFMVLLAAFKAQLSRYCGETDIVVGSPVAGRGHVDLEPLIGFFVNNLVLRTDLAGDPPFTELIRRVRRTALDAYDHQELPFEKLVDELRPTRNLSVHPLAQVNFQVYERQNLDPARFPAADRTSAHGEDLHLAGLHVESLPVATRTSKFDLSVEFGESGRDLTGRIEYSTDLYDGSTIERFADNLTALLEGIAAGPDSRLSELPPFAERERVRVLEEWNDTARPGTDGRCLHELVQAQAERVPDAVAVIAEDVRLTYRELDESANALAHHLRALGTGTESMIGVCVERSAEFVIAALAVLKAGGVYLGLDPDQPVDRLASLLTDAGASMLITRTRPATLSAVDGMGTYVFERDWATTERFPTTPPVGTTVPQNLAYAIHTSGSTGRPKCVVTPHAGIVNYLTWLQSEHGLSAGDRVLHKAPFGFDVSVWEIFWPLSAGATVVPARPGEQGNPRYLVDLIRQARITVAHFVPSVLRFVVAESAAAECAELRLVICGGEAITTDLVSRFHRTFDAVLHNQYGPAEASIQVTGCDLRPGEEKVSLGRPVWNTRVYVLDAAGSPVPQGAIGELYLTGVQLARGYHDQPGMTAERFLPDPFGAPGGRMYRTGDLVRWLPDGTLEFLGRTDHQVKIGGVRIEPGEIQSHLTADPAVRQAVVVARQDASGDKRLVAYVVPHGIADPGRLPAALRAGLSGRLPGYLVPSAFVVLDSLPLNRNGKVDVGALPPPAVAPDRPVVVAPRTRAERVLGEVWQAVLRLDEVGVHDNFFALGGDSIRAIEVTSLAAASGLRLRPNQLFQHQSLAELASAATETETETDGEEAAQRGEVTGPVGLTPIQRSFVSVGDARRDYQTQYLALEIIADLPAEIIGTAVDHLVRHHDMLRARLVFDGGSWTQTVEAYRPEDRLARVTVDAPDLDALLDDHATRAAESLDPLAGRMARAVYLERHGTRPVLLMVVHHLCVDAVSWRILTEDLDSVCRQLLDGRTDPVLPARTTSFPTWAERLHDMARSPELAGEAGYWRSTIPREPESLPRDGAGTPGRGTYGDAERFQSEVPRDITRALIEEVPDVYRTQVNDVLLTALALAFGTWTGSPRLLVDLEGHGREPLFDDVDLTRTVGWFTSVFPVYLDLPDPADVGGCLVAVKETLRAVPRRGIGLGLLRDIRADEHRLDDLPQAEVLFNYLGRIGTPSGGDALVRQVPDPVRAGNAPSRPRTHLIEAYARIQDGRLVVHWSYDRNVHDRSRIEGVAGEFTRALERIVEFCRLPDSGGRSASDYPLTGLSTAEVRRLFGSCRGVEDIYPLSTLQTGILFHTLTAANADVYLTQVSWELGDIDAEVMALAWQEVTRRTAMLRTRFTWKAVYPALQVVERDVRLPVTRLDWSDRDPDRQRSALEDLLDDGRRNPFDLERAPIARITLIKIGPGNWRILLETHHILLDGWSITMLIGDALAVYQALVSGAELRLPARRPFRDFIAWQGERETGMDERYWRNYLAGFTEPTTLPVEPSEAAGYGVHHRELPAELSSAVQECARRLRITPSTLFQAGWSLMLGRYTNATDVVFGATVSGRADLPGMEQMIGLFINTLPVRVRLGAGDQRLDDWLREIQTDRTRMPSEQTSLADITAWSETPPRRPLFDSIVVVGNYPVDDGIRTALGGMSAGALRVREMNNYPLSLIVNGGAPYEFEMQYDRSAYGPAMIEDIDRCVTSVLRMIVTDPGMTLAELVTAVGHRPPQGR